MIHFERWGTGDRLVVALHGWGGSHRTFAPLAPYVPATSSLLAADLPGYGRSPRAPGPSAADVAACVARAISDLPGAGLTLAGNCSGAIFALLAAPALGDRVSRIVLIDPFAFVPWYFRVFIHPTFGRYAYYSTFGNPLGRWMTNASLRRRRAAGSDLTRSFQRVDHQVSLQYLAALDALGHIDRFRPVRAAIDIAYGARTFAAVKASVPLWQAVFPEARVWRIDGAGHLPLEEAPAQAAGIIFGAPSAAAETAA